MSKTCYTMSRKVSQGNKKKQQLAKVYILDDQNFNLGLVGSFLTKQGFQVFTQTDSKKSITEIKEILPDLILLDIFMPYPDGFTICRQLKSCQKTKNIPIIFITGSTEVENRIKALESGSIDLLAKPLNLKELLLTVNLHLRLAKLSQDLVTRNKILSEEIAKRKKAELELKQSHERLETLIHNSFDGIIVVDLYGKILFVNQEAEKMFRRKKQELIGNQLGAPVQLHKVNQIEIPYLSGEIGVLEIRAVPMIWEDNNAYLISLVDVTEKKKMEDNLKMLFRASEQSPVSIVITNIDGNIQYVNPKFEQVSGYSRVEVIGKNPSILSSGHTKPEQYQELWQTLTQGKEWQGEFHNRRKNGELYWEKAIISPVFNSDNIITHYVAVKEDITLEKQQQTLLEYQARYDNLTNIPNRLYGMEVLKQMLKKAQEKETQLALMFIDLDHFKEVNDNFGHDYGDELLIQATTRIKDNLRSTDLFARLGGDEFLVAIPLVKNNKDVELIAEKITNCLQSPFSILDTTVLISASIGISFFPHDANNLRQLVKNADQAMYESKEKGRDQFQFYCSEINEDNFLQQQFNQTSNESYLIDKLLTEDTLQCALENRELEIVYQPIIDLRDHSLKGLEISLRYNHPQLGFLYPQDFLPFLSKENDVVMLEKWLLTLALEEIKQLQITDEISLHFNLSAECFTASTLVETFQEILMGYKLDKMKLFLEINERSLLRGQDRVFDLLHIISDLSIGLSLDNFGHGICSLTNLHQVPFEFIKIDASLIGNITDGSKVSCMVKSIIEIAKILKIKTIAQGLQSRTQAVILHNLDCRYGQGSFFSHPLCFDKLQAMLNNQYLKVNRPQCQII